MVKRSSNGLNSVAFPVFKKYVTIATFIAALTLYSKFNIGVIVIIFLNYS